MILRVGPTSNTERQRRFRERNPGYFRKYSGRRKASAIAAAARNLALHQQMVANSEPLALPPAAATIEIPQVAAAGTALKLIVDQWPGKTLPTPATS